MRDLIVLEEFKDKVEKPKRSTKLSAGYDLCAAEDIVVPSLWTAVFNNVVSAEGFKRELDLEEAAKWVKENKLKTLIPTGVTLQCEDDEYLAIVPRSGIANKTWLMIPNSPGTIDVDYYPNQIYVGVINVMPFDIKIKKGERIAQAIFNKYGTIDNEEEITKERNGGFGSTSV